MSRPLVDQIQSLLLLLVKLVWATILRPTHGVGRKCGEWGPDTEWKTWSGSGGYGVVVWEWAFL